MSREVLQRVSLRKALGAVEDTSVKKPRHNLKPISSGSCASTGLRLQTRPFSIHDVLVELGDFHTQITAKRYVVKASQYSAVRKALAKFKRKQDQDEMRLPAYCSRENVGS
jgi:hypothetical protein